eukprot:750926-Hanusia_phi.AAC.2
MRPAATSVVSLAPALQVQLTCLHRVQLFLVLALICLPVCTHPSEALLLEHRPTSASAGEHQQVDNLRTRLSSKRIHSSGPGTVRSSVRGPAAQRVRESYCCCSKRK